MTALKIETLFNREIQIFGSIIKNNLLYIDKTEFI